MTGGFGVGFFESENARLPGVIEEELFSRKGGIENV